MRYFNYVVILAILVVSALLGKGYLGGGPLPSLQSDLKRSLDAFWQNERSVVEVLGTPAQAEVRASVDFPPNTGARKQQWMNALIPFVASRHRDVKLGSVRVTPLSGKADTAESDSRGRRVAGDSLGRPNPLENVANAEGTQRNLQAQLDAALGPGRALILLDAEPVPPASSLNSSVTSEQAPGPPSEAAPPSFEGAPAQENSIARPAPQAPAVPLAGVVVVQVKEDAAKASNLVGPSLSQLRMVVLP